MYNYLITRAKTLKLGVQKSEKKPFTFSPIPKQLHTHQVKEVKEQLISDVRDYTGKPHYHTGSTVWLQKHSSCWNSNGICSEIIDKSDRQIRPIGSITDWMDKVNEKEGEMFTRKYNQITSGFRPLYGFLVWFSVHYRLTRSSPEVHPPLF